MKSFPACDQAAPASPTTLLDGLQTAGAAQAESGGEAPAVESETCAALPGYRFMSCSARHPGGESWDVILPDGRRRLARLVYGFGDLAPAQEREALCRLTALSDPALPRAEAVHSDPGRFILVTELSGGSLRDRLEECRAQRLPGVPRLEALSCLRAVAEALDRLHQEHGLQHLALNPANVMLRRDRVLLYDYGLAALFWLPGGLPAADFNPRYAAPELFRGEVSRRCDQYSLALIYQELLTGLAPFQDLARPRTAAERPRRKPDLALLPAGDRPVILRALHRDPAQRFRSCTELVRALEDATPRKEKDPADVLTTLPTIITWPAEGVLSTATSTVPPLEELLPQFLARAAGPVQVQEYRNIHYLLHPGESLRHHCAAWLPPGVAQIKLTAFARQWAAEVVRCDDHSFVCYVTIPGAFWRRCLGRPMRLEVNVRLWQPPAPVTRLTQVDVGMTPHGVPRGQQGQLLWEAGPPLLESLRTHLQAPPEQRHQPRLLWHQPVRVAPARPGRHPVTPLEVQGKDLSPAGVGFFLPDQPAAPQVYLNLGRESFAAPLGLLARIVRVQPCGDGWYEVGAAFPVGPGGRDP